MEGPQQILKILAGRKPKPLCLLRPLLLQRALLHLTKAVLQMVSSDQTSAFFSFPVSLSIPVILILPLIIV